MTAAPLSTPLVAALKLLAPHEHLCSIYENEQEHFAVAAPFVKVGLERGERCIYIAGDAAESAVRAALHGEGIDVERAMQTQGLLLLSQEEVYLRRGRFDPNRVFSFWKEAASKALHEGFAALRLTGETQWILKRPKETNRWIEYESRLTHALAECRCIALCQYNRQRFPPELILDVIRTHPVVAYRTAVSRNMYHVPPDEFLGPERSAREVERLLAGLYEREQIDQALPQQLNELRDSEQRFRLTLEGVKDYAIFSLDTKGYVASWNAGAKSIEGYGEEEILGKHFSCFYPAEQIWQDQPDKQLKAAVANGKVEDEGWRLRKDGTQFWASVLITALRDEKGKLIGFSKLARDITERKRTEEHLRRSEAYLAEGQRISHTGSWAWNVSSGEMYWSLEHFRIFGLDPSRLQPSYELLFQLIHPEDSVAVDQRFQNAVRMRSDFDCEFRAIRPDGALIYIHSLSHPVFNESGELTEYVGTVVDMTERKLAEEALRTTQAELARALRVMTMGELTASIAHEVNQPLAAVIANGNAGLRWLGNSDPSVEEARKALLRIIRDANRASEVIARIRALLKKTSTERQQLNMNEVIEEVIALARGELRRHEVAFRIEPADRLPPVLGDRVQLQQVMLNLVMNSTEAMSDIAPRLPQLTISTSADEAGRVLVAVHDSGTGLDSESMKRAFEAFYTTKKQGMGIGLSISRSIIEAHGGSLWSEANDGPGATFKFTLPVHEPGTT